MKIALVCPYDFSRPGGVKSHIVSLSKHLTIIGHQVKIIAPNINANAVEEKNVYFFGKNRSVNIGGTKIDVNIALGDEKKQLKAFLNGEVFDIIHYHTIWNPLLPFQVLKHSKAKQIATFHDTPKSQFVGDWIMPTVARGIFTFLDQIISVSNSQSGYISRFSKRNIHIIPNGIDLDEIHQIAPQESKRDDDFFQMFFMGRLEPRKGVMHALRAFHQLKERYPKMKLIIAGDGDGRAEVEQYITDYTLTDVEMVGFVSEAEKYRLLKESDIYLAPALYGESFGIVLLESMAVGTPIAGYANSGYKNVITNDMMKGFAEPGDLDAFAKCIENLIPSSKREELSKHGLEEVKKYNWAEVSMEVNEVYLK
ncbi:phosphatidylinositol alpha-mannosyltransferase [Ekhidna lutea]|uniref:Phosphatidylinositol alpha-mannosyltransferase n=1 Tax=Ekhidna lutea TaxID=447679 RepID=A0A239FSB4_EKHLU|nr:glycosyltransferase family 4 protein [Ekhidna lutea]SNS59867.1 phosphatidylinositol alpha-mannosyltransferase [Ekhidna lutea]